MKPNPATPKRWSELSRASPGCYTAFARAAGAPAAPVAELGVVRRRYSLVKTTLSGFWYVTLFLLSAVTMMSAEDVPRIPKHFRAYIGGGLDVSYQVEFRDGILTYTTFGFGHSNPKHAVITTTEAQWRKFRQTFDDLKVWQWRADYPTNGTVDGTQWSLDIAYADHAIKTRGNNSYPDATGKPNGKPEPTKAFNRYLDAVKKLTGGKTFQ